MVQILDDLIRVQWQKWPFLAQLTLASPHVAVTAHQLFCLS